MCVSKFSCEGQMRCRQTDKLCFTVPLLDSWMGGQHVSVAKLSAVNYHPCDPLFLFHFTWFTGFTAITFRDDRPASTYKAVSKTTDMSVSVENARRQKSFQHVWTGAILWLRGRERFKARVNILLVLLCLSFVVTKVPNAPFFSKMALRTWKKTDYVTLWV